MLRKHTRATQHAYTHTHTRTQIRGIPTGRRDAADGGDGGGKDPYSRRATHNSGVRVRDRRRTRAPNVLSPVELLGPKEELL